MRTFDYGSVVMLWGSKHGTREGGETWKGSKLLGEEERAKAQYFAPTRARENC